jgi:hypothetical protein
MTKMKKNNLELLKVKQQQVKVRLAEKETDINNKLNYLEHNFGSMALNSILRGKSNDESGISTGLISGLAGQLGEIGLSQVFSGKIGGLLGYKLSGFLLKILKKYL